MEDLWCSESRRVEVYIRSPKTTDRVQASSRVTLPEQTQFGRVQSSTAILTADVAWWHLDNPLPRMHLMGVRGVNTMNFIEYTVDGLSVTWMRLLVAFSQVLLQRSLSNTTTYDDDDRPHTFLFTSGHNGSRSFKQVLEDMRTGGWTRLDTRRERLNTGTSYLANSDQLSWCSRLWIVGLLYLVSVPRISDLRVGALTSQASTTRVRMYPRRLTVKALGIYIFDCARAHFNNQGVRQRDRRTLVALFYRRCSGHLSGNGELFSALGLSMLFHRVLVWNRWNRWTDDDHHPMSNSFYHQVAQIHNIAL